MDASSVPPVSLVVLISGGGTTLRNLIERIEEGVLRAKIRLVISSHADARGLEFARQAGIPTAIHSRRQVDTPEQFSQSVFQACRDVEAQLVVMAGFLKHVLIPDDYSARVMNIHPSLIPAFCGKGFYGRRVHQAALDYGVKFSGCTVHFVDNQYDHGPIILQHVVPVLDEDDAETLAARVFEAECKAYPEAIQRYAAGKLTVEGRRVRSASGEGR